MDNRYIGVFDSGLGGLTTVKELKKVLPNENIVYFGDTGRVPYGSRSEETIVKYVIDDINFLLSYDIKLIIIACGTASTVALPIVKNMYEVPMVGVVEPSVKKATQATKNKNIGVIGTSGTINSGKYVQKIKDIDKSINVYTNACPLFVPIVENGYADTEIAKMVAQDYLNPLIEKDIDTLILGCTHYPILKNTVKDVMGDNVELVDSGAETAKYVSEFLSANDMLADEKQDKQYMYFVSDNTSNFSKIAGVFLGENIDGLVEKIDIENY